MTHFLRRPRFPPASSPVLLWCLAFAAAAALCTVAVVAWQAASRQRRDGEGALRQAAAEAAELKASSLQAILNADRSPFKMGWSHYHPPVARTWFIKSGDPQDWIFGPWPQPENEASRTFNESTALAQGGRKDEARKVLQPLLDTGEKWYRSTTTSGLPLRPLVLRLALSLEPADSRQLAISLADEAALLPSPLSAPLFDEAMAALPNPTAREQDSIAIARNRLKYLDQVRAALLERREDVIRERPWIVTARGEHWHLDISVTDRISALPMAAVQAAAADAGLRRSDLPALPQGWTFRARLDNVSLTSPDDPALTPVTSHSRGPLVVEAVANPQTAFSALDAQLLRQRWLISGATAFMCAAAAAFLLVLARQRRLNTMMANFVAAVSHELRAPVGSMGLLAERLSDGRAGSNGDQTHYHRLIRDECRRLSSTIGNVLTFSRHQRGLTAFESELSDLTALLNDTIDLMRPQADERSLILSTDFPDKPVERELDPVIIRQAVLNLLDNAIKFSPPGGTVRLRLRESEDNFAVITVRDEGPGIPPAERTRIFKPFYRTGSELRRETPGIGIGLAIVQAAAQAHGGTATASPAPGHGAEFTLRLPPAPSC